MLNKHLITQAFKELDAILPDRVNLLIGGGSALLLLKKIPISTMDIDAICFKSAITSEDLKPYREKVAEKLQLPPHWINEYFYEFTHCLPPDYNSRLIKYYRGRRLTCFVMSATDIAIMKLFAGRNKDLGHLRYLFAKKMVNLGLIETHLNNLTEISHPGVERAVELFEELRESLGIE